VLGARGRPPPAGPSDIPAFVKVRERPLKTHVFGRGGTVFVCPPAWGLPGEMAINPLRPHADAARFFTFDPSGTGESTATRAKEDLTSRGLANDCTGLLLRLKLRPMAVLGHSHGGLVAMRVALNHPELVRKLVVVSSTPGDGSDDPWAWRALLGDAAPTAPVERREEILKMGHAIWARSLADPSQSKKVFGPLPDKKWKVSIERFNASPKDSQGLDLRPKLPHIRAPTLILHGRKDPVVGEGAAEEMRKALPNGEIVYFEKSGHFPMLEEPLKFATVLGEFLRRD